MTLRLTDPMPPFTPPSENPDDPRMPVTPPPDQETEPDVPERPHPDNEPELPDRPGEPDAPEPLPGERPVERSASAASGASVRLLADGGTGLPDMPEKEPGGLPETPGPLPEEEPDEGGNPVVPETAEGEPGSPRREDE